MRPQQLPSSSMHVGLAGEHACVFLLLPAVMTLQCCSSTAVLLCADSEPPVCPTRRQMRYTLGSWGSTRSYVIGYGPNQPQRPHHRQTACSALYNEPCSLANSGTCCAGESGARGASQYYTTLLCQGGSVDTIRSVGETVHVDHTHMHLKNGYCYV
jgi:hypothetical protein